MAWYRFENFERTLFERIGEVYSITGVRHRPYLFGKSAEEERVALRAWDGKPVRADMAEAIVFQCQQNDVFDAVITSAALQPHLLARIGPDAILVDSAGVDRVRAVLEWAGVRVSQKLSDYQE